MQIHIQEDGDIILAILPDPSEEYRYAKSVEFCTIGAGGGRSPNTRKALLELFKAIELDNLEDPQNKNP
jgi:hypothetical protein